MSEPEIRQEVERRIEEAMADGDWRLCPCVVCWSWEPTGTRRIGEHVGVFCDECWPTMETVVAKIRQAE